MFLSESGEHVKSVFGRNCGRMKNTTTQNIGPQRPNADHKGNHQTLPIWVKVSEATRLTGLGRSRIYELMDAGHIESSSLREKGQKRATRLIRLASLLAFIEAHTPAFLRKTNQK